MLPPPPPYSKLPPRNQTSPNFTLPRNENSTERSPLLPARNPTPVPRRDNTTTFCSTVITPPADPVAVIVPNPEPSLNGLIYFFVVMLTVILSLVYLPPYIRDVHRSQAGVSWDSPLQGQCVRYGSSGYTAKLLNYAVDGYWSEACAQTPIFIHGRKMRSPIRCELAGNEVIGYWEVGNDAHCQPFWGSVEDEYCAGSDKIISLPLLHVQSDTQWEEVCMTTPFHSEGNTYFPTSCENRGTDILAHLQRKNDEGCTKQERVQERREAGVSWSVPQPGSCLQYAVRKYSTTLLKYTYDNYWQEACETTELLFDGLNQTTSPTKCELVWDRTEGYKVFGHWEVMNYSPDCTPYWVSISNEHCVGTNRRMVSARLWNIQDSKLWDRMCSTAPLTLQNVSRVPLSCENKGIWGMWGHWEIEDDTCAMFTP